MEKLTLILDIDSTVYSFLSAMSVALGETWNEHSISSYGSFPTRASRPKLEAALEWAHTPQAMHQVGLYEGAAEAVRAFHEAGIKIVICTHRPERHGESTRQTLTELGLVFDDFHCHPTVDKTEFALAHGAWMMLDDKPSTVNAALAAGLEVAGLDWPYTSFPHVTDERYMRSSSWDDLREVVLASHKRRSSALTPGV